MIPTGTVPGHAPASLQCSVHWQLCHRPKAPAELGFSPVRWRLESHWRFGLGKLSNTAFTVDRPFYQYGMNSRACGDRHTHRKPGSSSFRRGPPQCLYPTAEPTAGTVTARGVSNEAQSGAPGKNNCEIAAPPGPRKCPSSGPAL